MNKVIIISLSGKAYQLEENAHGKLQAYLGEAEARLANDPGKSEILADLERALADKCERFLSSAKNVITEREMEELLKEMGPVESSAEGGEKPAGPKEEKPRDGVKRLYRIREEGYFAGVCAGLAAYLNIDPTVVRMAFVLLTLFTGGAWILAYAVLMFILPPARTEAQKAAAFGEPFTAKDWVKNAREQYEKLADHNNWRHWKNELRQKRREERREQKRYKHLHGGFWPFRVIMGLAAAALSLVWFFGLVSLISTGAIPGLSIPATMPAWAAVLIWCCLYAFLVLPLKTARYKAYCEGTDAPVCIHLHGGFLEGVVRIALWAVLVWALWQYLPASHPYFQKFIAWGEHFRRVAGLW